MFIEIGHASSSCTGGRRRLYHAGVGRGGRGETARTRNLGGTERREGQRVINCEAMLGRGECRTRADRMVWQRGRVSREDDVQHGVVVAGRAKCLSVVRAVFCGMCMRCLSGALRNCEARRRIYMCRVTRVTFRTQNAGTYVYARAARWFG